MLMQLGAITFEVQPFNAHEIGHFTGARYAEKPVLGTRPPLEFIGPGTETYEIRGTIFPHKFGGLNDLEKLLQMLGAGKPQYAIRGDGKVLGWMAIEDVRERQTWLDKNGVPRKVEIDISITRSGPPPVSDYFSIIAGLVL